MKNGIHKNGKRNWELPLPLRSRNIILPNNKDQGLSRLKNLLRTLDKKPKMSSHYFEFHAGHIQQIFSQYRRLAFSADLLFKIETFAFFTELPTFCKMSADNASPHEWEKFC
jgi:hypothetical protein